MYIINKLLYFVGFCSILAGCSGGYNRWYSASDSSNVSGPAVFQYGSNSADLYGTPDESHKIAVLLPTSGPNANVGHSIRPAIEMAISQYAPKSLQVNFFDTGSGDTQETIKNVLDSDPDIVIGPVFSQNARIMREIKSSSLPVLSFTSDISAIGSGVISVSLMPANTVEATLKRMQAKGAKKFVILAPDNQSGHTMAGIAKMINGTYNLENVGVFFYTEGDVESLRLTSMAASMYSARCAANTRAKEILSNLLNHENLTPEERSSVASQLARIKKRDSLGGVPYDSILFLGNGKDTKDLVSFLRFHDVSTRDVKLYGTFMWDGSDIASDISMTGAEYTALPEISSQFARAYQSRTGHAPERIEAIGYDATMLAIDAIYSKNQNSVSENLMSQSGYVGTNGLFRLRPNGSNERALQIIRVNGDDTTSVIEKPATTFTTPMYSFVANYITPAEAMPLNSSGINPNNYIKIPERFRKKYQSKTIGANYTNASTKAELPPVTVLPKDENSVTITAEGYQPVKLENVSRTNIDSVEVSE